jgi:hypothetical protein
VRQTAQAQANNVTDEETAVHAWRVSQLTRLGLSASVADTVADNVDWHDLARLVRLGCPASLAVAILQ